MGRAALSICIAAAAACLAPTGWASAASPISWSAPERVLPGSVEFTGVACPSSELCVAVDKEGGIVTSVDPSGGVATWHGAHLRAAAPSAVTCPSTKLCLAWGAESIESSTDPAAGAGAWTGRTIDPGSHVDAVSCPDISLCLAITGANSLFASTDAGAGAGARWKLEMSHIDASHSREFGPTTIAALACPSVELCVAVDSAGRMLTSTHPTRDRPWHVVDVDPQVVSAPGVEGIGPGSPSIAPTVVDAALTSVSCPSIQLCVAVDEFGTIAYSTDPTGGARAWKLSNEHPEVLRQSRGDVSCASVSLCVYVGPLGLSGYTPGSVRVAAGPPELTSSYSTRRIDENYLDAVACAPTNICVAVDSDASVVVGTYAAPTNPAALASEGARAPSGSAPALGARASTAARPAPCVVRGHVIAGVAHSRVISVSGEVVVYRVRHEQEEVRVDTVWVCDRRDDRAVRIGDDEWVPIENLGEGQVANKTLEHLQIAGPWILATQTGDEDEGGCFKYEVSNCDGPSNTLVLANAAVGLAGSLASIRDYVDELSAGGYVESPTRTWTRTLLSPQGAVAWLEESGSGSVKTTSLYGCLAQAIHGKIGCAMRTHVEGDIEPDSVRLSHTTLTWMVGGSAQSAVL
jgi:hypothetical protein